MISIFNILKPTSNIKKIIINSTAAPSTVIKPKPLPSKKNPVSSLCIHPAKTFPTAISRIFEQSNYWRDFLPPSAAFSFTSWNEKLEWGNSSGAITVSRGMHHLNAKGILYVTTLSYRADAGFPPFELEWTWDGGILGDFLAVYVIMGVMHYINFSFRVPVQNFKIFILWRKKISWNFRWKLLLLENTSTLNEVNCRTDTN